jgi:ketol-acid reductoisomerase
MKEHLREIEDGEFAKEWSNEQAAGYPVFNKLREEWLKHPINKVEEKTKEDLKLT